MKNKEMYKFLFLILVQLFSFNLSAANDSSKFNLITSNKLMLGVESNIKFVASDHDFNKKGFDLGINLSQYVSNLIYVGAFYNQMNDIWNTSDKTFLLDQNNVNISTANYNNFGVLAGYRMWENKRFEFVPELRLGYGTLSFMGINTEKIQTVNTITVDSKITFGYKLNKSTVLGLSTSYLIPIYLDRYYLDEYNLQHGSIGVFFKTALTKSTKKVYVNDVLTLADIKNDTNQNMDSKSINADFLAANDILKTDVKSSSDNTQNQNSSSTSSGSNSNSNNSGKETDFSNSFENISSSTATKASSTSGSSNDNTTTKSNIILDDELDFSNTANRVKSSDKSSDDLLGSTSSSNSSYASGNSNISGNTSSSNKSQNTSRKTIASSSTYGKDKIANSATLDFSKYIIVVASFANQKNAAKFISNNKSSSKKFNILYDADVNRYRIVFMVNESKSKVIEIRDNTRNEFPGAWIMDFDN
jgi:hypothetical protein